jgi:hypothetical protein
MKKLWTPCRRAIVLLPLLLALRLGAEDRFPGSPPRNHQVVMEMVYEYTIRDYAPPVRVAVVPRDASSTATPEDAAIAHLSALQSLDYEWWSSLWTESSLVKMAEIDKAEKRGREFWIEAWERAFRGRAFELTQRLDTGDYVIIVYREQGRPDAYPLKVVLKHEKEGWRATQDLSADPVLHHWNEGDARLRNVVRSVNASPR